MDTPTGRRIKKNRKMALTWKDPTSTTYLELFGLE